jgi:hypothetical protein
MNIGLRGKRENLLLEKAQLLSFNDLQNAPGSHQLVPLGVVVTLALQFVKAGENRSLGNLDPFE